MGKSDIEELLLASIGKLRKYAYSLTLNWDRADDLLQETFTRVLCNVDKFENDGKFISWTRAIMHNAFINCSKREERYQTIDERFCSNQITTRCDTGSRAEINDIYNTLDKLPGNAGTVMRLFISGHKYIEISVIMNIPLGTVKTRINLSRAILREKLKDYLD